MTADNLMDPPPRRTIAYWCGVVHKNAVLKGWWDEPRTFPEVIALVHCELSEAMEEYRDGRSPRDIYTKTVSEDLSKIKIRPPEDNTPAVDVLCKIDQKPEGIPIELADVVIRIMDYCEQVGINLEEAICIKHAYNKTRPHRHGGKRL